MTPARKGPPQSWDLLDGPEPGIGAATTITENFVPPKHRPKREFPPGFHGANPGPSYDEDEEPPPPKKRTRRTRKT